MKQDFWTYNKPLSMAGLGGGATSLSNAGSGPYSGNIALAHNSSPYISVYSWDSLGFGSKYSNPSSSVAGNGNAVAFSPDGTAIAIAHNTSPYISVYEWTSSGFGSKYSNPSTLPSGSGYSVAFSPDGTALAVGYNGSSTSDSKINVYPWSSSGFGSKYSDPSPLPPGYTGYGLSLIHI